MLHQKYKKAWSSGAVTKVRGSGRETKAGGLAGWPEQLLPLPVSFAQEGANRRVGRSQRFFIRQEHDAEMLRSGTLAEAGAVHHHYMLLADQFGDKDVVPFRNIERGIRVERATRYNAADARSLGAPLHRQIAPRAQLAFDFGQVVLRAFECGLDCIL